MKIIVITPIYATTTLQQGTTPVVHYFAREWVKMGHDVKVFFLRVKFPRIYYYISKRFQHQLSTRLGMPVHIEYPRDENFVADGVSVSKRTLSKIIPHSRYSMKRIKYAQQLIFEECENKGVPDWFIGHWDNPQLELLCALKRKFQKPVCLVLHSNEFNFESLYGAKAKSMLAQMDVIGFRNKAAQQNFESKYGKPNSSFLAFSGVSESFLNAGKGFQRRFEKPVKNFIFVGLLIARKHPKEIITALNRVYTDGNFKMTYIGDGAEKEQIEKEFIQYGSKGEVVFTGRIPRDQIIDYLKESDVFVMISHTEIFGLVYLEAMALGVIPIGSKDEGIDGIIRNGENGFLCKAGDVNDLISILKRITERPAESLQSLSSEAMRTALEYSDFGVAEKYIKKLSAIS